MLSLTEILLIFSSLLTPWLLAFASVKTRTWQQPCPKDLLESDVPCSAPGGSLWRVTLSKCKCCYCYFSLSCRWKILRKLNNAGCGDPWEVWEENLSHGFLHQHPNHYVICVCRITIYKKASCPLYTWSIVPFIFYFYLVFFPVEHVLPFCLSPGWKQLINA